MNTQKYTRDSFNLRDRIEGATRNSIILKGDNGEKVYCNLRIFDRIMNNPTIEFMIQTVPAHKACNRMGCEREFSESKWICAFIPTRLGIFGR